MKNRKPIKTAIVDYRMKEDLKKNLEKHGFILIDSYKSIEVDSSIEGHVDISVFFSGKALITSPSSFEYYKTLISRYKLDVVIEKGEKKLSKKYPKDVAYNLCYTGKFAIGNFDYTDEKIISYLKKNDAIFIPVSQGYSNCSILVVDEESIITSDEGIVREVLKYNRGSFNKIDLLKIKEGSIRLSQMNHGFIGGASALVDDKVYFFGDVNSHPDSESIRNFIMKKNKVIVSLGDGNLIDYGGMICLDSYID